MDNKQNKNNNCNGAFKFGSILFAFILVFLIINLSFAWYAAKSNQVKVENLTSEGITIKLNSTSDKLSPDILKEGVLTTVNGEYVLPSDYILYTCATCNKSYTSAYLNEGNCPECGADVTEGTNVNYIEKAGNSVKIEKASVEVYLSEGTTVNITSIVEYKDQLGKTVELTDSDVEQYFNITYSFVDSSGALVLVENLISGTYTMTINISYKLPDELLPANLVNAEEITLVVRGTLQ